MVDNFYQSSVWREINQYVYKKPVFEHSFFWETYFWIIKTQRRLWKEFRWYMIQWIEWIDWERKGVLFEEALDHVKRDYGKTWGDIFFQCGIVHNIASCDTAVLKKDVPMQQSYLDRKSLQDERMRVDYWLVPSWREHMPDTTIVLDLTHWIQSLRRWYSKSCKRYINKAKKENLVFIEWKNSDIEAFWHIWYTMSYDKWFSVLWLDMFKALISYLESSWNWTLLLAKKWKKIVAWSVVVYRWKTLVYLYWATDRSFGAIWWHYRLTDQIMKRWADNDFSTYDLLWVAPIGNDHHYLSWVTRFKQSFWWTTVVSVWNYDLVFNSLLYRTFQFMKTKKLGKKVVKEDVIPQKKTKE